MNRPAAVPVALVVSALAAAVVIAQRPLPFLSEHPAIQYDARPLTDPVARLNRRLADGQVTLTFDTSGVGYLRSVLNALQVPVESQALVFSKTSLQGDFIDQTNPRAIFFNDTVYVAWVNGTDVIEVASEDPQQGVAFYTLTQKPSVSPQFKRSLECNQCHLTEVFTRGVPGTFVMSVLPLSDDPADYAQGWSADHRTPMADRWGGWFVTGTRVPGRHLGNVPVYHVPKSGVRANIPPALTSVKGAFDDNSKFLSLYSDVAALMVMHHQVYATNLLTRVNWLTRIGEYEARTPDAAALRPRTAGTVEDAVTELVDYLLFVDEVPLTSQYVGSSGFTDTFSASGPRDRKGRSFHELDLERRLLRYPCSYMIYSEAFDALPASAKDAVYQRMWLILSGHGNDPAYDRLSLADRQAVVEILKDTKKDLPAYFTVPTV